MAGLRLKQSVYFSEEMLEEIRVEAERLNRSLSWVVQRAWKAARRELLKTPSANEAPEPQVSPIEGSADARER